MEKELRTPKLAETDRSWEEFAECRGEDNAIFFPESKFQNAIAPAIAICGRCVVREECLEYALANKEDCGIWGGKSEKDREKYRKKWLAERRKARRSGDYDSDSQDQA